MNNFKTTKRALLTSVLSMVLCFTMLLGTTFAWFTDSVTSKNNIITAGNLDVELKYAKIDGDEITDWDTVGGKDNIFDKNALWEPGRVEVVYLEVANLGSLELKYQLGVNVANETPGINVAGEELKLSDHLVFSVVELADKPTTPYTREEAIAAAGATMGLKDYNGKTTALEVDGKDYVALIVYMPTTVGNEANYRGTTVPTIELGINLFATQASVEEDSFGKDYDEDAWMPEFKVTTGADLQAALENGETNIVLSADIELTESLVIPAAATTYSMRSTPVVIDLNGKTITGAMHKNDGAIIKNEGSLILKNGTVSSLGNNGGSALVNKGTAVLENVTLNGAPNADGSWPSYTVNNTGVLEATNVKITSYHGAVASYGDGALVTLNNSEIDMAGIPGFTSHGIYAYNDGAVVVNGGTYANKAADQASTGASVINGNVTIYGGTFSGRIENYYGTPVIYSGTFSVKPNAKFIVNGYESNGNTDGTWTVAFPQAKFEESVKTEGAEVYVPAGTYTFPSNVAEGVVINCAPGTVFTGTTGLNLPGATVIGGTFTNDSGYAVSGTINGTFKNCTFEASEALRWCYTSAGEEVVFENCTFKTDLRGIHFDEMNGDVKFINCEINGFNAYSGTGTMTFVGCTFGNDESKYNGLNIYSNTVLEDCEFNFVSGKTNFIDMEGTGKTLTINNCTATLDGEEANVLDFVGGSKLDKNTLIVDGMQCALNADQLVAAINAGAKAVILAEGDYALRFTNNTNFNLNDMTIKGLGDVNLAISSSEAWYGRVQGSNVTFENIHFTSSVGATGKATYNNCTFDDWTICASSNKEETTFNNCTINGCLNTSTDFSSGDVFVNNCKIAKAEYSGSMTMNFVDCQIDEIIIWNANTNLTNCEVTKLDDSNVTNATVTIK